MSALEDTMNVIQELRDLIAVSSGSNTATAPLSSERSLKIRKTLLKLRRSHAKLREFQAAESNQVNATVARYKRAKLEYENSCFVGSQCQFLVEKFNSAQCPELDKVSSSLPSVEEYTKAHSSDPGFVSYELDPHQFMLSMLASELTERKNLEKSISDLISVRDQVKGEIVKKQKFLSSIGAKLGELSKSVEGLKLLFPSADQVMIDERVPLTPSINTSNLSSPILVVIAEKFSACMDPHIRVKTEGSLKVVVEIGLLPSAIVPANTCREIKLEYSSTDVVCSPCIGQSEIFKMTIDSNRSIADLVSHIRQVWIYTVWRDLEIKELGTTKQICTNTWFDGSISSDWRLTEFQIGKATIQFGHTSKVDIWMNMSERRVRFERVSSGIRTVSSMTSSDEGEIPAIVDIELAQVEEDVNEWWSRRYAQVGDYVIGETSGVIAKCASCFSRII